MTTAMNVPGLDESAATSIVICCYSDARWSVLNKAILSAVAQHPPADEVLVVVDHNPELFERLRLQDLAGVTLLQNTQKRGLSGARNTGVAASSGAIVLFLDDDAVADEDMLLATKTCVSQPGVMGAMAAIRPMWEGRRAGWFPGEFLWTLGCTYDGLKPGPVRNLIGAAMCMRRTVLDAVGGFDSSFGRTAGSLPMGCEETELCIRAAASIPEGRFLFDASSGCDHAIPAHRATWRYLVRRCWAEGISKAALSRLVGSRSALKAERSYVRQTLPRGMLNGMADLVLRSQLDGALRAVAIGAGLVATAAGYAYGLSSGNLRAAAKPVAAE